MDIKDLKNWFHVNTLIIFYQLYKQLKNKRLRFKLLRRF